MEKRDIITVGGNVNSCVATMEDSMKIPKKLRIELPYDPVISLLDI